MIKLTAFYEGTAGKTNKAKEQPVIPIAAFGRNYADRCKEIYNEASALLVDLEKQSSANPGYPGASTKVKAALAKVKAAMDAFSKVQ